ncbi:MAG: hypothetical protein M3362_24365 [Acidobacteriota bacterium]|nr:hypothetical protein [Acidobacteriota bacterium]
MLKDRISCFLRENIFPNIYAFYAQRKLRRKIYQLQQKGVNLVIPDNKELDLEAFIAELKDYQDKEDDRKKAIDDKAKSSLFVITLSLTVILAGLNFLKDGKATFRTPLLLLVILGIAYFVLSGITAVRALNVREFFALHPDDWIEQAQDQPTVVGLQKLDRIKWLYTAIKANEPALNIKTNFVDATFVGIRNGLVLLSLAFVIAVGNIGNQVRFIESPKSGDSVQSNSNRDSRQDQHGTPLIEGASTQEGTISNSKQSEVDATKGLNSPNNK